MLNISTAKSHSQASLRLARSTRLACCVRQPGALSARVCDQWTNPEMQFQAWKGEMLSFHSHIYRVLLLSLFFPWCFTPMGLFLLQRIIYLIKGNLRAVWKISEEVLNVARRPEKEQFSWQINWCNKWPDISFLFDHVVQWKLTKSRSNWKYFILVV